MGELSRRHRQLIPTPTPAPAYGAGPRCVASWQAATTSGGRHAVEPGASLANMRGIVWPIQAPDPHRSMRQCAAFTARQRALPCTATWDIVCALPAWPPRLSHMSPEAVLHPTHAVVHVPKELPTLCCVHTGCTFIGSAEGGRSAHALHRNTDCR